MQCAVVFTRGTRRSDMRLGLRITTMPKINLEPTQPISWTATVVGECCYLNLSAGRDAIENRIGKPREPDAPDASWMNQSPGIGPRNGHDHNALKFIDQRGAETGAFFLQKPDSLKVFILCVNAETEVHRSKARAFLATSSLDDVCARPASTSRARRADSSPHSRSNSGSETSSRLNRSRCAREARASTGRDRASVSS